MDFNKLVNDLVTATTALKAIAQLQRDKCETANAEMLFILLDNKVGIATAALAKIEDG